MVSSPRLVALENALDDALRHTQHCIEEAAADVRRRGLESQGDYHDIPDWLRRVAEAVVNKAIEFDRWAAELELKKLRLNGQCDNPFSCERVDELNYFVRRSIASSLSLLHHSPYRRTICTKLQSLQGDRQREAESKAAQMVAEKYAKFLAEFEVDRELILAEQRTAPMSKHQPPAPTSAEQGEQAVANPEPSIETNANGHATADQPPASAAGGQGEGDGVKKASGKKPKPSEQKAYFAWLYSEAKLERKLNAREAFEYLHEHGIDDSALVGELAGYTVPEKYSTFEQQASRGRKAAEQPKNTSRADRPIGRSIVPSDEIEFGRDDGQ